MKIAQPNINLDLSIKMDTGSTRLLTFYYFVLFDVICILLFPQDIERKLVIAGRPKSALLFWFFGDFRCGALLFMVIHVIYKYKNR